MFVTNWISTTKIQKISEITNFFRHYFLSRTEVIFDEGTNVKFATQLVGNKLIITETGDYGKSGQYGYYTLVAKVGIVKDGDYVIVVKRNDHVREEFSLKYDSSRANKDN